MTVTIWYAALAVVALGALTPALLPSRREAGYPLAGNVVVGLAVVALGVLAPSALATHWTWALVALGVVAIIPLGVDAWLDRPTGTDAGWAPSAGAGPEDGGGSGAAVLAASTAALSAATCAMNAAVTVALIH